MSSDNYIAWNIVAGDKDFFKSESEAKKWCDQAIKDARIDTLNSDWGWNDGYGFGGIGYAKIIMETELRERDNKENYPCLKYDNKTAECSSGDPDCPEDCPGTEEWPYSSDFDSICDLILIKKENKMESFKCYEVEKKVYGLEFTSEKSISEEQFKKDVQSYPVLPDNFEIETEESNGTFKGRVVIAFGGTGSEK